MKEKHRFFAKHAKSSAMLISLAIHAGIVLIALTFVVITVVGNKDPEFVIQEYTRPRMPPRKIQIPVKIEKKKTRVARLRETIVSINPKRTTADIQIPETPGILRGFGTLNAPNGLGKRSSATARPSYWGCRSATGYVES